MTDFRDLEPWTMLVGSPAILAVGWISRDADYPTGVTDETAFRKIAEIAQNPWKPVASAGFHHCEICQYEGPALKGEMYVPGDGCIYVAPVGIVHYMAAHWYKPPAPFIAAALACPSMRSMEYKRAILANGGRVLLHPPS